MLNFLKSKTAKAAVGLLAIAMMFAVAHSASAAITHTLKYHSTYKTEVMELQNGLNSMGFANPALVADGSFGAKTLAAVKAYQANKGLVADGIFGPKSLAAWTGTTPTNPVGTLCPNGMTLASNCTMPPSGGTQTGPVMAMLATNNPATSTLVAGQATADLAHFTFSGTGTVTNVTLKRIGVSADSTPTNVYLFDGATRLTDASSVSNNGMISFNVPAGIFTVAGTRTISVKSDIAASTSGQTVGMMLSSFMTTGSTTAVTANLSGNIHSIASASLASVTGGTETPTGATLNPGAGVTVWQNTLSIGTRDVWMKRFALRNVGSAPASAFQNFKLFVNGTQVATAAGMDAMGYVTFDMNAAPVLLVSGSRVVRVDADIVSGASRTVQFSLRQAADADFVDSSFGVNIVPGVVNGTTTDALPWAPAAASTISGASGGTLTIEKDVTSPSGNVSEGTSDKTLGIFKVTAYGEPMKIENIRATFTSSDASVTELRNGRILIGGVQYGSTATLNEDSHSGTAYTQFTTNYTVMPGTPVMMELRADMYDNDGTDNLSNTDTIVGTIAAGSSNVQKVDSLGSVSVPSATTVAANTLTIADASATLTKNGTYANQTVVLPSSNFKIGSWTLAGSANEDILLSTLSFDVDEVVTAEFDEGDIRNMYVVVKDSMGNVVAQPSPLATVAATDNNFSVNYTLLKNATLTIELFANLADDGLDQIGGSADTIEALDSFKTDLTVTGTAMVSGAAVNASSGDVDGQTIAAGAATVTVSKDASSPVAAIVFDNQTVTTLAAKFDAVTSGYTITDLTATLSGTNASTVVQSVMLYDGGTLLKSIPMTTSTTAVFNGLSVLIPANTNKVLTVKVQVGTVGVGLGSSGAVITTSIAAATDVIYKNESTGVSTSSTTEEAGTATGSAMYAYASIPTISSVTLPTQNLVAGTNTLAKFSVTSNGGTVGWNRIVFSLTKTSAPTIANGAAFSLWNADTNTLITAGTATVRDTADAATCLATLLACRFQFVPSVEQQVSGTVNYALKATVGGTLVSNDYISTTIAAPSVFAVPDDYTAVAASGSFAQTYAGYGTTPSFIWSDISGSGHDVASTTVLDWNNDYLVKNLPLDSQTVTKP